MALKTPATNEPKPEDIDALLDQVEKKFLKSPEARKLAETSPQNCPCTIKHPTNWKEVDEMLKDFQFEDSNPFSKSKNKPWARQEIEAKGISDKEKQLKQCLSVYLAGSYEEMGYCVLGAEKPCSNLKCLKCDFAVIYFDNFVWHQTTDYLFLRNNMPDFDKLVKKLSRRKGSRAYACQCQHVNTNVLMNVMAKPELRWICGKHVISNDVT